MLFFCLLRATPDGAISSGCYANYRMRHPVFRFESSRGWNVVMISKCHNDIGMS